MPEEPPAQQVSAVEIARLAGVGRAAVSNWRRRHADFPKPVGGGESSPAFALADVQDWLRGQGKLRELPLRDEIRRHLDLLRDPAASPAAPLVPVLAHLLLVQRAPERWAALAGRPGTELATALPEAAAETAAQELGARPARDLRLPPLYGTTQLALARLVARLAGELGPVAAAEELLALPPETAFRQGALLPDALADLLAELAGAGEGSVVLDPACGTGAVLLAAARRGAARLYGQEPESAVASAALLRLALHAPAGAPRPLPVTVHTGDALRQESPQTVRRAVDAVVGRPPYNDRNWGSDDLAYDPRWVYGLPPRAESELAWVQHAVARLRPGGRAALLLPAAVAARRSGRRVRAELLRRGVLAAVLALPAGLAAPLAVPLHIWVLTRPAADDGPPDRVLLADVAAAAGDPYENARAAWRAHTSHGPERPGLYRAVPLVGLLDEETDVTPARHLRQPVGRTLDELSELHDRVIGLLAGLAPAERVLSAPEPVAAGPAEPRPLVHVSELLRTGGLELVPDHGTPQAGDVLVRGDEVRVLDDGEEVEPGLRGCQVLRVAPDTLDPWFLAGFLRAAAAAHGGPAQATTSRRDVRRLRVPRLSLDRQRRYGAQFRRLAVFEHRLNEVAAEGTRLARGIAEGIAAGILALPPEPEPEEPGRG